MHYKKIHSGDTLIEFHNNWLGQETVIVNGQIVSKKSSVWGAHHPFTIIEAGEEVRYVLTTKANAELQVFIDLSKNGEFLLKDDPVSMGSLPARPKNTFKINGISLLQEYELKEAILELKKALDIEPADPEIYFHLACAYSIQEDVLNGFESLKKSVENKLHDTEKILNHDMLAYLRMHPAFEDFLNSNFSKYDLDKDA